MDTKAYTQVYNILEILSESEKRKIPEKILIGIKNKMDKSYDFEVDEENIEEIPLLEDTEKILSVIYTDYLATDEEKEVIKNKERICLMEKEKRKQKNYSSNVFADKKEQLEDKGAEKETTYQENENKYLTEVEKEKWYHKIINFIKKLFHKKK